MDKINGKLMIFNFASILLFIVVLLFKFSTRDNNYITIANYTESFFNEEKLVELNKLSIDAEIDHDKNMLILKNVPFDISNKLFIDQTKFSYSKICEKDCMIFVKLEDLCNE